MSLKAFSLFLIYIYDLPDGIKLICKFFANDTSFFSKFKNKSYSAAELNSDLKIVGNWAIQWKILFNPDPNNQTIEILFSKKTGKRKLPTTDF